MHIQVNTDNQIDGTLSIARLAQHVIVAALGRFRNRITRIEVHMSDESSKVKVRDNDKRCVLEARVAGLQPITVSNQGALLEHTLSGAAKKLKNVLDRRLGQLDKRKGRTSFAGDEGT